MFILGLILCFLWQAEAYAASVSARHYGTSAKLNKGIDELFLDLSKRTSPSHCLCLLFSVLVRSSLSLCVTSLEVCVCALVDGVSGLCLAYVDNFRHNVQSLSS